jgi:choline dehydrogenase-like flavoprotein
MQKEGKIGRWPGGITYQLLAVRARSRGSVSLASADITDRPAIDLAYLSDPAGTPLLSPVPPSALPSPCKEVSDFLFATYR